MAVPWVKLTRVTRVGVVSQSVKFHSVTVPTGSLRESVTIWHTMGFLLWRWTRRRWKSRKVRCAKARGRQTKMRKKTTTQQQP